MNSKDIQNLQESYLAVYDDDTRETLEFGNWVNDLLDEGYNLSDYTWDELYETYIGEERAPGVKPYEPRKRRPLDPEKAPSGEMGDGSGYGADEKFKKPDDKIQKPGTEVPAPKKGGYGRILSNIPYGIGAHANRQRSRNSTVRGMDPGAPRSEVIAPKEKKKASKEVVRKEEFELWVNNLLDEGYDLSGYTWEGLYEEYILNEAYDLYDVILSHLIDEGYADTQEQAEAIMVNMSEDWRESICESILDTGATIAGSVVGTAQRAVKNVGQKVKNVAGSYEYARQKANGNLPSGGMKAPMTTGTRPPSISKPASAPADMKRAQENAAGMRGPELSHSAKELLMKGPKSPGSAVQKTQPRGREFTNPPS